MQAIGILQEYLDEMGRHVLAADFDAYVSRICLPFHLLTAAANMVITTEAELRAGFDTFDIMLKAQRVTDYIRLAAHAMFVEDGLISGHYTTHFLSHSQRIVPPFPSQMVLRRTSAGVWQAASITNGLKASSWPVYSVQSTEGPAA